MALKARMQENLELAQTERIESHLAYVGEEMRFWRQRLENVARKIKARKAQMNA